MNKQTFWKNYWEIKFRQMKVYTTYSDICFGNLDKKTKFSSSMTICDFGSGAGYFGQKIAEKVDRVILIDQSKAMIEYSKKVNKDIHNIDYFLSQKIADLDGILKDNSIDKVIINSVIQYLSMEDINGCLEILHRKLVSNGEIYVVDIPIKGHSFSKECMEYLCAYYNRNNLKKILMHYILECLKKIVDKNNMMNISYFSYEELVKAFGNHYEVIDLGVVTISSQRKNVMLAKG